MNSRATTAWVATGLLLSQASIGIFALRRRILREPHIVLGLILPLLTFSHAWLSMKSVSMKSANMAGLWLATAALVLLGVQALLGIALIRPSDSQGSLKRVHLALGVGILALASEHVFPIGK